MSPRNLKLGSSHVTALQVWLVVRVLGSSRGQGLDSSGQVLVAMSTFPSGAESLQRERLQMRNKAEIHRKCWNTPQRRSLVSHIHIPTLTSKMYAVKFGHGLIARREDSA